MKDCVLQVERSSFETVTNVNPLEIIPPTGVFIEKYLMLMNFL